jgi:hypothetical protein
MSIRGSVRRKLAPWNGVVVEGNGRNAPVLEHCDDATSTEESRTLTRR